MRHIIYTGFVGSEILKTFFLLVCYMDTINKFDRHNKLYVFIYLPSIIAYSINGRHPMSEYLHIREYSDIFTIVS